MLRKCVVGFAIAFSLQMTFGQDFKKSYSIPAGGQIVIWNYHGDIKVEGYKGDSVEIVAEKKGSDRNLIEIIDGSHGARIDVHPRYLKFGHGNAKVDFEIRVPQAVEYNFSRLSSLGGKVQVSNVIGQLRIVNMRGNIELKNVRGLVSASSHSGNVNVEIEKDSEKGHMRFDSISGNIEVRAPSNLDAFVEMSSFSGSLKTDFLIEIQEMRYGSGRSARGKLGSGKQFLHIRSVQGQVSLIHK